MSDPHLAQVGQLTTSQFIFISYSRDDSAFVNRLITDLRARGVNIWIDKDLRSVIERPALLSDVQITFEGDLVGDLLFEVQGQAGALRCSSSRSTSSSRDAMDIF
jgi:hypothetical protein